METDKVDTEEVDTEKVDTEKVEAEKEARFSPALEALRELLSDPEEELLMVAIDGRSGSGKSTLAEWLAGQFPEEINVFHLDDFYLRPEQRTEERLRETGGNVDYERFRDEVLIPVFYGDPVQYRPFDCRAMELVPETEIRTIRPKRINIFEGSYSMHPYFGAPYRLRIFMDSDPETQLRHIAARLGITDPTAALAEAVKDQASLETGGSRTEGGPAASGDGKSSPPVTRPAAERLRMFRDVWIPKEEAYFAAFGIREKADLLIL